MRSIRLLFVALCPALLALPAGAAPPERAVAEVHVEKAPTRLVFRTGKALAGAYLFGPDVAKPYFWPLNAPNGVPITRPWPMERNAPGEKTDHVHQKSAWFCYGDIIPEGIKLTHKIRGVEGVDFWSEAPGHGRIVCTRVGDVGQARNHGWAVTHNEWRTASGQKILDEQRTIHLYNYGTAYLWVLDIDLAADVVPITFGDTKEGALGVRVRESVTTKGGKGQITNAEGKVSESGCWGRKSAWCDYSGPVGGAIEGIAIFADPSNPYPSCWHVRGYGLMAANPFGRTKSGFPDVKGNKERVHLDKGQHLKLRYGLFLHEGDTKAGRVADFYQTFVGLGKERTGSERKP